MLAQQRPECQTDAKMKQLLCNKSTLTSQLIVVFVSGVSEIALSTTSIRTLQIRPLIINTIKVGPKQYVVEFLCTADFNARVWNNKIGMSSNPTDRWKGNSITYDEIITRSVNELASKQQTGSAVSERDSLLAEACMQGSIRNLVRVGSHLKNTIMFIY